MKGTVSEKEYKYQYFIVSFSEKGPRIEVLVVCAGSEGVQQSEYVSQARQNDAT